LRLQIKEYHWPTLSLQSVQTFCSDITFVLTLLLLLLLLLL
jgi:hypothetical protein